MIIGKQAQMTGRVSTTALPGSTDRVNKGVMNRFCLNADHVKVRISPLLFQSIGLSCCSTVHESMLDTLTPRPHQRSGKELPYHNLREAIAQQPFCGGC